MIITFKCLFQYLAALTGSLSIITVGINVGWTSPYLPVLLNATTSPVPITPAQASWCATMALIGCPFGALIGAMLVDRIGRKLIILSAAPFVFASYICIAYANNLLLIFIPRFVIGMAEGLLYTTLPMYIAEIADPKIRGFLGSSITVAYMFGVFFINLTGSLVSTYTSSMITAALCLAHVATFAWMPESPYYLIKNLEHRKAAESLQVFRGTLDVDEEMRSLSRAIERQAKQASGNLTDLFLVKSNRKASLIYVIVSLSQNFGGKNPLIFFTTMIFQHAGISRPDLIVIIYSFLAMISLVIGLHIIDRIGRRPLLIFSASGTAVSLAIVGLYFFLQEYARCTMTEFLNWLLITAMLASSVTFSVGLSFGPVLLLSELFPINVKGKALGLGDSFTSVVSVVATQYFQVVNETVGMYMSFWTFSVSCVLGAVFIYYFVIETKGKSLEQIQLELIGSK